LHTLKGNSASMGLVVLARLCHGLEQQLEDDGRVTDEALEELSTRWHTVTDHIQSFAGGSLQRTIEVSESDYVALVSRISTGIELEEVQRELLTWQLEPVTRPLQRLADQAKALARQLDKGEIEVAIQGNGVRLDPDAFGPLFSVLVHLIRNAVDHGLESPAEREALKKPHHRGTVILKAEATEDTLVFEISDDGRGIDWNTPWPRRRRAWGFPMPHPGPDRGALLRRILHQG
jgi:chemotaxis protein histidine kinase CheA